MMKKLIDQKIQQLKNELPAIFMTLKDKETPLFAKVLAGITVAYALSPIDLIPDFIPILGYLDDIIILPCMVWLTIHCLPKELLDKNRDLAKNVWKNGKPKKWVYATPILMIWGFLILWILKIICNGWF